MRAGRITSAQQPLLTLPWVFATQPPWERPTLGSPAASACLKGVLPPEGFQLRMLGIQGLEKATLWMLTQGFDKYLINVFRGCSLRIEGLMRVGKVQLTSRRLGRWTLAQDHGLHREG